MTVKKQGCTNLALVVATIMPMKNWKQQNYPNVYGTNNATINRLANDESSL